MARLLSPAIPAGSLTPTHPDAHQPRRRGVRFLAAARALLATSPGAAPLGEDGQLARGAPHRGDLNNARLTRAPLEEEVPALKREPGKDIVVFGGGRIAHSLMRHRLIDEYRLTIQPVALGDGMPLMQGLPEPRRLELISSTAYADGCVAQVYRDA